MSRFLLQKKKLIFEVYEKAKKETTETSFSGILKNLEITLKDDYHIQLSYKTFETYYRFLVENEEDYNIKLVILDDLSAYLGAKNFKIFSDFIKSKAVKTPISCKRLACFLPMPQTSSIFVHFSALMRFSSESIT